MNVEIPAYKSYNCAEYFAVRKTEIAVFFVLFVCFRFSYFQYSTERSFTNTEENVIY